MLKPLGLEWRAKKIMELIQALSLNEGEPPTSFEALMGLPGIGFYAASAFFTFHLRARALIIDSNAVRLWSRFFGFDANVETRRKRWLFNLVDAITPLENHTAFNYAVLDHTRNICRTKPLCEICPMNSLCFYTSKNRLTINNR